MSAFNFVDLFAGIGGFHAALTDLGGTCVYAVEKDANAAKIYELNWGIPALGDITHDANESTMNVPPHDVLVGGFPCQPFSKSGKQGGISDTRGTLFWNILAIIKKHHPALVVLENVRNLAGPQHRDTWDTIIGALRAEGYHVSGEPLVLSPHHVPAAHGGAPQNRERVFITATYAPHVTHENPPPACNPFLGDGDAEWNLLRDICDANNTDPDLALSVNETLWIDAWGDLVRSVTQRTGLKFPAFPLWADFFHSTHIPASAPGWKQKILAKNIKFYADYRDIIDPWAQKWGVYGEKFPASRRKFEWHAGECDGIWSTLLQLRPSGIRAKKPTVAPTLVAIAQTTIVGPLRRRLSVREAARLQGLPETFSFGDQNPRHSMKQLGNGVNVGVVKCAVIAHVQRDAPLLESQLPKLVARLSVKH